MTVDFVDLDWVIIALFMRVNLLWKMEFSCIRKGNWVDERLADFSFYVWVGGLVLLSGGGGGEVLLKARLSAKHRALGAFSL